MIPRKERKVFSRKERKDFADFAWNKTLAKVQFKEVSSKNNLSQKVEYYIYIIFCIIFFRAFSVFRC